MGGQDEDDSETLAVLRQPSDHFEIEKLPFTLEREACSVRMNQTHGIVARNGDIYFYEDSRGKFVPLKRLESDPVDSACGLVYTDESGYQFFVAGGHHEHSYLSLNTVNIFQFGQDNWAEGSKLPITMEGSAYLQIQNTFLIIGGLQRAGNTKGGLWDVSWLYDAEAGWVEVPMKLPLSDYWMGALHVSRQDVSCKMHKE